MAHRLKETIIFFILLSLVFLLFDYFGNVVMDGKYAFNLFMKVFIGAIVFFILTKYFKKI